MLPVSLLSISPRRERKLTLTYSDLVPGLSSINSVALSFGPRQDGKFIKEFSNVLIAQGKYSRVPLISGDEEDEGTILSTGTYSINTDAAYEKWLSTVLFPHASPAQLADLYKLYPQDPTQGVSLSCRLSILA